MQNQAGEPGGDELSESGVGGEGVVLELLHRGRAGPVPRASHREMLARSYVCPMQTQLGEYIKRE
jgi:hypothetical protein